MCVQQLSECLGFRAEKWHVVTSRLRHFLKIFWVDYVKILHAGVKLMQQKVLKVSRRYRFSLLSYCEKTRGGAKNAPPPVNGGLKDSLADRLIS